MEKDVNGCNKERMNIAIKIYYTKCIKFRKFVEWKIPKMSYIIDKALVLSIILSKSGDNDEN